MFQAPKCSMLYAAFCLWIMTPSAFSAEWTASAGVAPQIVYTDNVCLSAENKQGEVYSVITPSVNVTGNGNRANVSLSASAELNNLTGSGLDRKGCNSRNDRDRYTPRLNANADVVLVEQWLFFDANASVSQNAVNSFAAGGGDSQDRTGNTNTTARYSLSPYISRRIKDVANLTLRYTYDDQYNSKDIVGDNRQETVLFSLNSNPSLSKFSWGVQANYDKIYYDETIARESTDSELASARVNFGLQFSRSWQLNGYIGNDANDFVSVSDSIDGSFWDLGLRWTPTARTSIEVGTGDRFFGNTPRFSISHRHKHSMFTADYSKTITYDRNIRTLDNTIPGLDEPGQPTTISSSPILDERFTLGYRYEGRRSSLSMGASHSDQTRADTGRNATYKDISVRLSRNLSRKLSVNGGVSWYENEPAEKNSALVSPSETWRLFLGAQRDLGPKSSLSVDYVYTDRQSDVSRNEYTENRISLTFRVKT